MGEFLQLIGFAAVILINWGVMTTSIKHVEKENAQLRGEIKEVWVEMRAEVRAIYAMLNKRND